MPASVQVQPCSTPSSFRPDLKQKKSDKAPSGSTARHPIPTYDTVQVQCIQKVSICSNPPRSPFRASSDFLFVKTFRPTHTRLRSRMFLPLSAANHTAGRRSCLYLNFIVADSDETFTPNVIFCRVSCHNLRSGMVQVKRNQHPRQLMVYSPPYFFSTSRTFHSPKPWPAPF